MSTAPHAIAEEAGLRHVDVTDLTISRRRRGRGFSYLGPRGGRIDAAQRRWIEQLAIPPAWTDVRIAASHDSHLLATGIDDAGRRQYRYHPGFRQVADDVKFARIAELGARIGDVRTVVHDAIHSDDERERLSGIVTRLIDLTLLRVGTERYADEHDTYGASTLLCEHASRSGGALQLTFTGKSGKQRRVGVTDGDVIEFVERRCRRASGKDPLFVTPTGWSVDGTAVKALLSAAARMDVSAKDLRTWGASATMIESLCDPPDVEESSSDPVVAAYDRVAEALGNTRAVARGSYVAPAVEAAHDDGSLEELWASSRSSSQRSRAREHPRQGLRSAADRLMQRRPTERIPIRRIGAPVDDGARACRDTAIDTGIDGVIDEAVDDVIVEEPLSIRLDGTLVTTTMRTPGHDVELAVGFCFTDGLLAGAPVIGGHHVAGEDGEIDGIVDVDTQGLAPTPVPRLGTASSSCGLCGRDQLDDLCIRLAPVEPSPPIDPRIFAAVPAAVRPHQTLFGATGSVHAAAVFDGAGAIGLVREDVGRHNAVDKVVGRLVLDGELPTSDLGLFVSGRASIEIVQKAWAAGFGTVLAVSAPTSLAVDGARRAGMTLAGFIRRGRVNVYTPERFARLDGVADG